MTDIREQFGTMPATLEQKTGRSLDAWIALARGLGTERHGEIVAALKREHGLGHGYANMIALLVRGYGTSAGDELLEGLFAGAKAGLRPVYDRVLEVVRGFGDDVEVAPKKTMVSFRRSKQFACFTPASSKRVDLGIALKDAAPDDPRVVATPGGMTSHVVRIGAADEIDADVVAWMRTAYERS